MQGDDRYTARESTAARLDLSETLEFVAAKGSFRAS